MARGAAVKSIRGGSGLGDSLYVQPIARHLVKNGESVTICSDWPDVFTPLVKTGLAEVAPFHRGKVTHHAHYTRRKEYPETDQFEDCCIQAGVIDVDMCFDWELVAGKFIAQIRKESGGRPIVGVAMPRRPCGKNRDRDLGWELEPDWAFYQRVVDDIADSAYLIQLGTGEARACLRNIHLDLGNRTTVVDFLDVASICDGFLAWCSLFVPLAESLSRPGLFVWSHRGLTSRDRYTSTITPEKIFHKGSSTAILDRCTDKELEAAVSDFFG
jgi:hypothetical protein